MPVTKTMVFSATPPTIGETPTVFNFNAISCWNDLKNNIVPDLNIAFGQMNTLETNVNAKEANAVSAALLAQVSANEVGTWSIAAPFAVSTVADLATIPSIYTTAIVKDLDRGGTFIWSSTGTANGGTVFAGATGFWNRQYSGSINVKWFGAKGDGVTDDTVAVQNAVNTDSIKFPKQSFLLGSISCSRNNVSIDFGESSIINNNVGYVFTFGASSDTPIYNDLKISGGNFYQADALTVSNYNYISVQGTKDFSIENCSLNNISNGGISIFNGCDNGKIDHITINGKTNYTTCRGIWVYGGSSDFQAQYVDTNSITRNITPFSVFQVRDIKITNCTINVPNYGIYLMNSSDCIIDKCNIDVSGVGATRCIAVNNYSPRTKVTNCTLASDRSATGILVTQCSNDIIIEGNIFKGSFGGNRAIYVTYLASALIANNRFTDITSKNIQVDMGGFANIRGNEFVRELRTADHKAVYCTAIDIADTLVGSTATVLVGSGVIFEGNILNKVCLGVNGDMSIIASNLNQPCVELIQVNDNTFLDMSATSSSEFPLNVSAGTSANIIQLRMERNIVHPYNFSGKNKAVINGTSHLLQSTTAVLASFNIAVATAGGAIVSTKLAGNNISCAASRSGSDLLLSPRTQMGASGAAVPIILGITDAGGAVLPRTYVVRPSSSNYLVSAYDSAGTQISFATQGISFNILVGPIGAGT